MNRIVLVGNGFDLHNGLDTDYESFIDWYLIKVLKTAQSDPEKASDNNFKVSNILDVSRYDPPKLDFLAEKIKKRVNEGQGYVKFANDNNQLDFKITISPLLFRIIRVIGNIGWSDIEAEYFTLLQRQKDIEGTRQLNACFEDLRTNLIEYLKSEESQTSSDNCFSSLFPSGKIKVRHSSFTKYHLLDYSEKQKRRVVLPDNQDRDEGLYDKIYFINFNYTNYWHSQFRGFLKNELEIINIHGLLSGKDQNAPFFGYGDDTSEEYANIAKRVQSDNWATYMKSIHYLRMYDYKYILDIIDSKPFQVVIAGHSCGLSDKTMLRTMFEHVNCLSIKPYFYKERDDDGALTGKENWLSLMANISRIFSDSVLMREKVMSRYDKDGNERPLIFELL